MIVSFPTLQILSLNVYSWRHVTNGTVRRTNHPETQVQHNRQSFVASSLPTVWATDERLLEYVTMYLSLCPLLSSQQKQVPKAVAGQGPSFLPPLLDWTTSGQERGELSQRVIVGRLCRDLLTRCCGECKPLGCHHALNNPLQSAP